MHRYHNAAHGSGTQRRTLLLVSPGSEDRLSLERLLKDSHSTKHTYSTAKHNILFKNHFSFGNNYI